WDGTVFEFNPTSGALSTLYSFSGPDGAYPFGSLIMDAAGNLYGTTNGDGSDNDGTVFELTPVSGTPWTLTIRYAFSGPDGAWPYGGLLMDAAGVLYGTTSSGGVDN